MSDLISRSELLEELKSLKIVLNGKQIFSDDTKDTVLRIINEQPTAYSVENVVEQLELHSFEIGIDTLPAHYVRLNQAIDIVKQGGVSDDCCEWESDYGFISDKYKRETQCGYTFYDLHHAVAFKYCPYCGKKIKEVD